MKANQINVAKFIVSETSTKNFMAEENLKSQDFLLGMEYVLASLEKIFEIDAVMEAGIDLEKAKAEMLEASGELED